jgi:hypothetical protein
MRKALNENPKVQAAVVGGMLLLAALFFMVMRPKEETGGADAALAGATAGVPGAAPGATDPIAGATATGAASATTPAPAATGATATAAPAGGTVTPEALVPGPGLPAEVVTAWARGQTIVLLIAEDSGTDDRLVETSVKALSSRPGLTVIVVPAKNVARYSRITQGVGVNRVPALVIVRPRRLSGPVPEAIVSYGFRNSESVVQAVNDALYQGRDDVPYHPG